MPNQSSRRKQRMEKGSSQKRTSRMFKVTLFLKMKIWKQSEWSSVEEEINIVVYFHSGVIIQHPKQVDYSTFNSMHELAI